MNKNEELLGSRFPDLFFPSIQRITHILITRSYLVNFSVEDVISDLDRLVDTPVNYFAKYLKNPVDLSLLNLTSSVIIDSFKKLLI